MFEKICFLLFVANVGVVFGSKRVEINKDICKNGLVDASTRTKDGITYLFKGDYYWRYIEGSIDAPKLIAADWNGITGPIDAAFTWNDGSTFIFKGEKYWRFINKDVLPGYPRKIEDGFKGIPTNIDAALVWENNGYTYFFKGDQYWRYMPKSIKPVGGKYPAPITRWRGVPDNVTAAVRWEDGLTYFFKEGVYYKYDNHMLRVPSKYPVSTAKAWFHCESISANETQLPQVWDKYEREMPKRKEAGPTEILEAIENLRHKVTSLAKEQRIIQYGTDAVAKEAIVLLKDIKKSSGNKEIDFFKHTEKVLGH